jgi:hypothetical protein
MLIGDSFEILNVALYHTMTSALNRVLHKPLNRLIKFISVLQMLILFGRKINLNIDFVIKQSCGIYKSIW